MPGKTDLSFNKLHYLGTVDFKQYLINNVIIESLTIWVVDILGD